MPDKRAHSQSVGKTVARFLRFSALAALVAGTAAQFAPGCTDDSGNGHFMQPNADGAAGTGGGGAGGDSAGGTSGGGAGGDSAGGTSGGSGGASGGSGGGGGASAGGAVGAGGTSTGGASGGTDGGATDA